MAKLCEMLRDERCAQTVEFVLWVPIIVALVVITVDASTLYITHNEMWNVARDTARRMSTGQIASAEEAEAYAASAVQLRDYPYLVEASFDPDSEMEVAIGMPFADISILGYSTLQIIGGTMVARVAMRPDPNLVLAGAGGGTATTVGTTAATTMAGATMAAETTRRTSEAGRAEMTVMPGIRSFLADKRGAVTTEFTALVPLLVLLLVFFADASVIYLTHTEMFNANRDIARRMSTGELTSQEEVRDYAASHLFLGQRQYQVSAGFGGEMRVTVAVPMRDAAVFGLFFTPLLGLELAASATVRREPLI